MRQDLDPRLREIDANWAKRWEAQVESFFEFRTAVLPWRECSDDATIAQLGAGSGDFGDAFPHAANVRKMADAIPPNEQPRYAQNSAGSWQAKVDLSARLMQAQRSIRHVPPATKTDSPGEQVPPKCSLLGSYEQMGPAGLKQSADFWQRAAKIDGLRLREGERLCAVALVKRFCGQYYFADELDLHRDDLRYEDTATVAAAKWLQDAQVDPWQIR